MMLIVSSGSEGMWKIGCLRLNVRILMFRYVVRVLSGLKCTLLDLMVVNRVRLIFARVRLFRLGLIHVMVRL